MRKCICCNQANARVNGKYCYHCFNNIKSGKINLLPNEEIEPINEEIEKPNEKVIMYYCNTANCICIKFPNGTRYFNLKNIEQAKEFYTQCCELYDIKNKK